MLCNYKYIGIYIDIYADLIMDYLAVTIQMNEESCCFLFYVSLARRL